MKKLWDMAPVIGLAFTLTACGGGSDGDKAVSAKPTLFDGEAKVYMYELDSMDDQDREKLSLTRKNDLLYLNSTRLSDNYSSYYLTDKALYQPETSKTVDISKGIRDSVVKSINGSTWVLTPYNQAGATDLEYTYQFKTVDLSGQAIAPVVAPTIAGLAVYSEITQADYAQVPLPARILLNKESFPQGSKCLRVVSTEANKNYLEFDPDISATQIKGVTNLQDWANLAFSENIIAAPIVSKENWAGYNWGALTLKNYNANGKIQYFFGIEYQGKVFSADAGGGKTTIAETIAAGKKQLLADGQDPKLVNSIVHNLENSCTFYNEAAATAIDKAVDKAKIETVNPDPEANDSAAPPSQEVIDAAKDALGTLGTIDVPLDLANQPGTSSCHGDLTFC